MIVDMLTQIRSQLASADQIRCFVCSELNLLQPWHLKVQTRQGRTARWRVISPRRGGHERAALTTEFLRLRSAGALPIAFAHMLSMTQTAVFGRLAKVHAQLVPQRPANPLPDNLDKLFGMSPDDTIKFD